MPTRNRRGRPRNGQTIEPKVRVAFRFSQETMDKLDRLCDRSPEPPIERTWMLERLIEAAPERSKR